MEGSTEIQDSVLKSRGEIDHFMKRNRSKFIQLLPQRYRKKKINMWGTLVTEPGS